MALEMAVTMSVTAGPTVPGQLRMSCRAWVAQGASTAAQSSGCKVKACERHQPPPAPGAEEGGTFVPCS